MLKKLCKGTIEIAATMLILNSPVSTVVYYGGEALVAGREAVGAIGKTRPAEKIKEKFRKEQ